MTLGREGSGNSRTFRPLSSRYSVIPSTVVTFLGAAGSSAAEGIAAVSRTSVVNPAHTARTVIALIFSFIVVISRRTSSAIEATAAGTNPAASRPISS